MFNYVKKEMLMTLKLGDWLRDNKMSQKELSDIVGVHPSMISKIIRWQNDRIDKKMSSEIRPSSPLAYKIERVTSKKCSLKSILFPSKVEFEKNINDVGK